MAANKYEEVRQTNEDEEEQGGNPPNFSHTEREPPPSYDAAMSARANILSEAPVEKLNDSLEISEDDEKKWQDYMRKRFDELDASRKPATLTPANTIDESESDDENDSTAYAAASRLRKDDRDDKRKAAMARHRSEIDKARRENSKASEPEEIELMIVSEDNGRPPREEDSATLRFRGASRFPQDDDYRSSGSYRSAREADRSWRETDESFNTADTYSDGNSLKMSNMSRPVHSNDVDVIDRASIEDGERDEVQIPDCPHPFLTFLVKSWLYMSTTKRLITVGVIIFVIGLLLLVTLLPASFVRVEYYEYALLRNKWTSAVDYSRVYDSGCYLMRPQDEMVALPATSHTVTMNLAIMNRESLSINLHIMLQYFLKRDEIPILFRKYHFEYDNVIRNVIESSVKNHAISFTMEDYRLNRNTVEQSIFETLQLALSGNCCGANFNCTKDSGAYCFCDPNPDTCARGKNVEVRYFQMGQIQLPEEVMDKYMSRIVAQIDAEREFYIQDKAVVEKETKYEVQKFLNKAKEQREAAEATAFKIQVFADSKKDKIIQSNYSMALSRMFKDVGVTDEEIKLSFIYLRALEKNRDNLIAVNYDVSTLFTP